MTGPAAAPDRAAGQLARADQTPIDRAASDIVRALQQRFQPQTSPRLAHPRTMNFLIAGGGSAITAGIKGWLGVDDPYFITGIELLADAAGTFQLDIQRTNFTTTPPPAVPTFASIIGSGTVPALTALTRTYQDNQLLSWSSRQLLPDDIVQFDVTLAGSATLVLVKIRLRPGS